MKSLVYTCGIGLFIIAFGYFVWFSPIVMLIGALFIIIGSAMILCAYRDQNSSIAGGIGCLGELVFGITIILTCWMGGNYQIFVYGGNRHLYEDCVYRESDTPHSVGKLSALIWGCSEDCYTCQERNKEDRKQKAALRREREKERDLNFIAAHIEELERVQEEILNGKHVNVEKYEFRYKVEDELEEEYSSSDYDPRGFR